jgi:hypothetical protein
MAKRTVAISGKPFPIQCSKTVVVTFGGTPEFRSALIAASAGNSGTGRGVTEFLKEALALWGERGRLRVVRAGAGFFDQELLSFLEERMLPYVVVARFTK